MSESIQVITKSGNTVLLALVSNGDGTYSVSVSTAGGAGDVVTIAQLPPAAVPADGGTTPSTTRINTLLSGYNGSTWDFLRTALVAVQTTFVGILNTIP